MTEMIGGLKEETTQKNVPRALRVLVLEEGA